MIVACPSPAFAFMLLCISHAITICFYLHMLLLDPVFCMALQHHLKFCTCRVSIIEGQAPCISLQKMGGYFKH